jgi:hypothetical protein
MKGHMMTIHPGISYNQIQSILSKEWKAMSEADKQV